MHLRCQTLLKALEEIFYKNRWVSRFSHLLHCANMALAAHMHDSQKSRFGIGALES